jgi:phosphohistidine swiveling domain-containing protein
LVEAKEAGLPVPDFHVVSECSEIARIEPWIKQALQSGPLIVRGALVGEDESEASWAGLSLSIAKLESLHAIAVACDRVLSQSSIDVIGDNRSNQNRAWCIVQREIARAKLLVVLGDQENGRVESYCRDGDVLANGVSPDTALSLSAAFDEIPGLREIVERCEETWSWQNGLDLEIVVDAHAKLWLVQARPLVVPLPAPGRAFLAAVDAMVAAGEHHLVNWSGAWVLDAEHNPEPLSPAHASLMDFLARKRGKRAGDPQVIAGWLYVRALPRSLPVASEGPSPQAEPSAAVEAVLRRLHGEYLPRFRSAVDNFAQRLADASRSSLVHLLDEALEHFLAMIDLYLEVLVPARKQARVAVALDPTQPATLADRAAYLDVLPASWDLRASPLSQWICAADLSSADQSLAGDPLHKLEAAVGTEREALALALLGEWDDHLFALGLAPLRWVYLSAAKFFGVSESAIFLLAIDEVRAGAVSSSWIDVESSRAVELERRRQRELYFAQLRPPLRIVDAEAIEDASRGYLRGLGFGVPVHGKIQIYRDLAHLLDSPPSAAAIVALPSLCAQAALVLHRLQVRAVCTEHGGLSSHGAIMARELGLSALIGCAGVLALPSGSSAYLDTRIGRLRVRAS